MARPWEPLPCLKTLGFSPGKSSGPPCLCGSFPEPQEDGVVCPDSGSLCDAMEYRLFLSWVWGTGFLSFSLLVPCLWGTPVCLQLCISAPLSGCRAPTLAPTLSLAPHSWCLSPSLWIPVPSLWVSVSVSFSLSPFSLFGSLSPLLWITLSSFLWAPLPPQVSVFLLWVSVPLLCLDKHGFSPFPLSLWL